MDSIIVSVIIPVFNEEKNIKDCLDSLTIQTYDLTQVEIIIVDGMSTDSTLKIVEEYQNCLPIKVLINEKRKVSFGLNLGITEAKGEFIIRLDGHSSYRDDYIEKCVFYLENTDADNVGGIAITKGKGFFGSINADILSSKFGVGGSKFRTQGKDGYVDTVPFGAFRRSVFERIGMFDTELSRSEDNDINGRIRSSGGKIYMTSEIQFTYYCRSSLWGLLKQAFLNGNALFFTTRKNKSAMNIRHFIPFFFVLSLLLLVPLSVFFRIPFYILICELSLYFLSDLFFSIFHGKKRLAFFKFFIYPAFHISYGVGSLVGLFHIKMY